MKNFTELLKEAMEVGNVSILDLANQLKITEDILSSYLDDQELDEELKQNLIEGVFKSSKKDAGIPLSKILFVLGMPDFQKSGKGTTGGVVGNFIIRELKDVIQRSIVKRNDHENLHVSAGIGKGTAARSVWIAVQDKRISPSATEGVYVVALFDTTGENLYLSIAYAVEGKSNKQLLKMVKEPSNKILDAIHGDKRFEGVISGPIILGEAEKIRRTNAKKYEKAVIVAKPYRTLDLNEEEFVSDVNKMLDLFYSFVYEDYLEDITRQLENEDSKDDSKKELIKEKSKDNSKKENTHSTIDPSLYEQLLEEKRKHNKEVGRKAEEFVYMKEREKLLEIGRSDLLDKVVHVAKEKDGYGYDIKSVEINEDGTFKEVFIEVKGSSIGGKEDFNFYLTAREDQVAKENSKKYRIALVEYVGFDRQSIFDLITPYDEEGNAVMSKTPTVFKCSYKKKK